MFRPDSDSSGGSSRMIAAIVSAFVVPLERPLAREQLVEDRAEREDVGAVVDRESLHLLGRHVARGPHDRPGLRVARAGWRHLLVGSHCLDSLRQAEVEDLQVAVSGDEEILGLQVTMDDPLAVRRGETPGNLQRVVHSLLLGDRTGVELPAQRVPLEKLHHGVGDAVLVPEIVNRQDVWMRQRSDRFRLALEAGQGVGISCNGLREDLDRHVPIQLAIPRAVDLPHPACAQSRDDLKGAETCAGCKGQAVDYTSRGPQKTFAAETCREQLRCVHSRVGFRRKALGMRRGMPRRRARPATR